MSDGADHISDKAETQKPDGGNDFQKEPKQHGGYNRTDGIECQTPCIVNTDNIIRNRKDYEEHLRYIYENPMRWYYDELYAEE